MAAAYGQTKAGVFRSMLRTPGMRREEREIAALAEEKLSFFGQRLMGYRWDQPAYSLSYANRRRLEIARAMGTNPRVLLLDEPAAGMNPAETHEITEQIDAALGAFWNYEGQELKLRGKRPRIIRIEEAGVPTYNELVLVANEDALERDGDKIRAFIGAVSRGTRDLRRDPDDGDRGPARRQSRPRSGAAARVREGHAAALLPAGGQAVRLAGPRPVGRVLGLDEGQPAAREPARPGERPTTTSFCLAPAFDRSPFGCGTIRM